MAAKLPSPSKGASHKEPQKDDRLWQFKVAYNNVTAARRVLGVLALVLVLMMLRWHGPLLPSAWLLAVLGWYLLDARLLEPAVRLRIAPETLATAEAVAILSWVVGGTLWASAGLLFWKPEAAQLQAVLYIATGFAAVAVGFLFGACSRLTLAGTLPTCGVWLWFTLQPSGLLRLELLGLVAFFLAVVVALSRHFAGLGSRAVELSEQNEALVAQLSDAICEAEAARRKAETANEAKSAFLANMSHEIRTPLNAILGFSEIIRDEVFGPMANGRYQGYADDIHRSGAHLLAVINDILDLSRIEAGEYEIESTRVDLKDVFSAVMSLFDLSAREAGVTLHQQIVSGLPALWADERSVRQILINLTANAIRFTPPGGRVTLSAGLTGEGGLCLRVIDTGLGISQDELERVTQRFAQGKQDAALRQRGTGLGLAIVKHLTEVHGGTLALRSRLGQGTQAEANFPPERAFSTGLEAIYSVA